jgi:DNA-binding NarL/FixJ family response regulator
MRELATAIRRRGYVAHRLHDERGALLAFHEIIRIHFAHGYETGMGLTLAGIAAVMGALGRADLAAQLAAAAEEVIDRVGWANLANERAAYEGNITAVRAGQDAATVTAAPENGRPLTLQEAVERAIRIEPPVRAVTLSRRRADLPDGITTREAEVLRLIAAGMSNREIADALVVSVRTVEKHIARLYAKIDAHGRADAATYAMRRGLLPLSTPATAP